MLKKNHQSNKQQLSCCHLFDKNKIFSKINNTYSKFTQKLNQFNFTPIKKISLKKGKELSLQKKLIKQSSINFKQIVSSLNNINSQSTKKLNLLNNQCKEKYHQQINYNKLNINITNHPNKNQKSQFTELRLKNFKKLSNNIIITQIQKKEINNFNSTIQVNSVLKQSSKLQEKQLLSNPERKNNLILNENKRSLVTDTTNSYINKSYQKQQKFIQTQKTNNSVFDSFFIRKQEKNQNNLVAFNEYLTNCQLFSSISLINESQSNQSYKKHSSLYEKYKNFSILFKSINSEEKQLKNHLENTRLMKIKKNLIQSRLETVQSLDLSDSAKFSILSTNFDTRRDNFENRKINFYSEINPRANGFEQNFII